jgi:aminoglycoside phosphotransferase (APT) family kinase protein
MAFPPAQGERLPWEAVPEEVRRTIEQRLGSSVATATTQPGGFSPGAAVRLELADGRRFFAKAVGSAPNPDSPGFHRREARFAAALPPTTPAPEFLFAVEHREWVALVFEDVDGHEPRLPWREDELDRVLDAFTDLSRALTPAPIEAPPVAAALDDLFNGWRTLESPVDDWASAHLEDLCTLEAGWAEAAAGETLLHCDVRADNILLTPDRVVFVDWPHACIGAAWIDLLAFLPSVAMQGGPPPWRVFESHPVGRGVPSERLHRVLAALAGFFLQRSTLPPQPGLSTLRDFQRGQGVQALAWLRRSLGES